MPLADRLPAVGDDAGALRWVAERRAGASAAEVLSFFDTRPAVPVAALRGRWRGSGLPTGSALDGLLEAYGWWGKDFVDAETVHPLLFTTQRGGPTPVNPAFAPLSLLRRAPSLARPAAVRRLGRGVLPLLRTRRPAARLRVVTHRGVATAALVYDALPVIDVFRRVDDDTVIGLVDMRGLHTVFPFLLHREQHGG